MCVCVVSCAVPRSAGFVFFCCEDVFSVVVGRVGVRSVGVYPFSVVSDLERYSTL